jgi:hypothetical protein
MLWERLSEGAEMKALVVFLFCVCLCGCSSKTTRTPITSTVTINGAVLHRLSDSDKVALLRTEAKKRGLLWEIFCVPKEDGTVDHYEATAWLKGSVDYGIGGVYYYEDGVRDWWADDGNSASEAAYALYKAIQRPPTQIAKHKPKKEGNCAYQKVLDSEHSNNIPCEKKLGNNTNWDVQTTGADTNGGSFYHENRN